MTSDILKRAAEAVEGVTPGPWRNEIRYSFIAHDNTWHVLWDVPNSTGVSLVSDTGGNTASCKNDARFIAAARTLIPDMAAAIAERDVENARLTARAEAAEAETKAVADDQNRLMQSFIAIEDERDKLRNQVAAITENRDRLMGYYNTLMDDNTRLRADLANAGAVMVEACARKADEHYAAGDMGNPGHHIRALSPLSPIAAAARVLLAQTEAANDPEIGPWLRALAEQEKAE